MIRKHAIVGSVGLAGNTDAYAAIEKYIEESCNGDDVIVSGGAKGVDSMAVEKAKEYGLAYKEFLPSQQNWAEFKKRNLLIAQECDALLRIVAKSSKTYGSGWTRDRAKEMGKTVYEVVIDA